MRLLVCGSRTFNDKTFLFEKLDEIAKKNHIEVLIEGECETEINADKLAAEWARQRGIEVAPYPALILGQGGKRSNGPKRNLEMLHKGKPDLVVAFLDKVLHTSRGTYHMLLIAERASVPTKLFMNLPGSKEVAVNHAPRS